jgi:nucleotide-binding universal stress UspA family protein
MFNNILVGVDGRQGGRDAIALAAQLADPDALVTLAHIYPGVFMPSHAVTPGLVKEDRERAEQRLTQERADTGIDAQLVVTQASTVAHGLHELAEERHTDLLVLGSSHRSAFGRAMLGNDTRDGLNGAPCAVAIADAGYASQAKPFATIGVGYNGSQESEQALAAAKALAERTNARVHAHQIVSARSYMYTGLLPPAIPPIEELVRTADGQMKHLPGVEGGAEYGLPSEDLAAFSKEVDLLDVGSRGYGPIGRLVHGSTSNYLQSHARSPLLVLPRGSEAATPDITVSGATSQTPVPA